jgi:hypothetical protein
MSINGISSVSASLSTAAVDPSKDIVGATMFKKALDIDASTALSLVNAAASVPSSTNLPPNLGQNVNTTA